MDSSDELLTIAELSIGLAGFSGVVAAFTHRGRLNEVDRFHFVILFSVAFIAVLPSFVPFGVHKLTQSDQALWLTSSVVMLVVGLVTAFVLGSLTPASLRANPQPGLLGSLLVGAGLPLLIALSQLANILGWPTGPSSLLYVVGLLGWVLVAGLNFVRLVLYGSASGG